MVKSTARIATHLQVNETLNYQRVDHYNGSKSSDKAFVSTFYFALAQYRTSLLRREIEMTTTMGSMGIVWLLHLVYNE